VAESNGDAPKPRKNGPGRPFQPGQSGNPGGRTKKLEELTIRISAMRDKHLSRLEYIADQGEHRDSIAAIKLLWAYAYGNPAQSITGPDGGPMQTIDIGSLSPAQLEQLRQILRAARGA